MNPTNRLDNLLKERKDMQETQNEIIKSSKYEVVLNFSLFHELSVDNDLQNYLIDKKENKSIDEYRNTWSYFLENL